ncbi:uncharacterized protein LOC113160307 isoform X2 [Anabas testudineus]|nr:uncharacterized protein LOC113160307 isoform X2 [Anabas testudineus]XP_026213296.1 uncharacterized protein LOC113160307 isoform X2 [Anabas testudineus]XP_026213297.1 uncharacterized protein LOC113160307 isoform X2 [Anabas testudineus]XP_026213298.1 uncharacterized protein LOC113160307 isoform X2 [Anabas testudineus]
MPEISEEGWKSALTCIISELDAEQYNRMLELLRKVPKGRRTDREKTPQMIIEHYGVEDSIFAITDAMEKIPRRDSAVQDLLRPFVEKLRNKQEKKNQGKKRKCETNSESEELEQESAAGFKKNNVVSDSDSSDEEQDAAADQSKKCRSDTEQKVQKWRKTIHDLRTAGDLGDKAMIGKVVQKSGLRTYNTKKKMTKFFFYLGVADDTASIKVMVYGKEHYKKIEEGSHWLFRNVIMDENMIKITKNSKIAKTSCVVISEELELEARMLIYPQSPVCSIKEAKMSEDKKMLSVEGTVREIRPLESLKSKRRKKERQDFRLEDETGFIVISLWGNDIKQLRGTSTGDLVRVTNVKTNDYYETVSLNSTDFTRIFKVQSANVQNVEIEIVGITKANKMGTELEANINGSVQTLVVDSPLIAKVFEIKLNGNIEEKLLDKMPLSAKAKIKGSKIQNMKAA